MNRCGTSEPLKLGPNGFPIPGQLSVWGEVPYPDEIGGKGTDQSGGKGTDQIGGKGKGGKAGKGKGKGKNATVNGTN
jgi:hypothetical protein